MRFKIGSTVEVWTKKKVPTGAWRCAEIVSDNGLSYTVRFYRGRGIPKEGVDEVKAEDIRPSAPLLDGCVAWGVGDVVEVLDDGYWKVSMIEEAMGEDNYQIHVIGSIDEFRVNKSSIRVRQEWKENKWMLMDKDCGYCEDMISRMRKKTLMKQQQCGHNWQLVPDSAFLSKMLKRRSPDSPFDVVDNVERVRRRKTVNKAIPDDSYSFTGKVDITTHPRENNCKNHLHYLTKKTFTITNKSHKNLDKAKSIARATELADSVSNLSSVGSCSVMDAISDRGLSHSSTGCSQDDDSLSSDAESLKILGYEKEVSVSQSKREDTLKGHDFDLHSYRYILETLYASGPLTWDQEALLTDIRMKFDVSNDEHLTELRRLKCVGGVGLRCY
ncbi:uncharacterized protein LOC141611715 [Silene latifolia]|uniref:uncharacterized protein LOC141611715 n=1 Tax=Silene latifolia TaxID=37657 RepID=UPI003D76CBA5